MNSYKTTLALVKIKFPNELWISELFRKFPDVKMEILHFLPYNIEKSIGNSLIEIIHYNVELIFGEIKAHKSVIELSIVEKGGNRMKFNVKTMDPFLLNTLITCGVLVNFPVKVEEGYAFWELISTRERIDMLLTLFEKKKIDYKLIKIGNSAYNLEDKKYNLNLEEMQVLDEAIKTGFFEVPRKISLEELADNLGKSKSALSVMLRKIIKKKILI